MPAAKKIVKEKEQVDLSRINDLKEELKLLQEKCEQTENDRVKLKERLDEQKENNEKLSRKIEAFDNDKIAHITMTKFGDIYIQLENNWYLGDVKAVMTALAKAIKEANAKYNLAFEKAVKGATDARVNDVIAGIKNKENEKE